MSSSLHIYAKKWYCEFDPHVLCVCVFVAARPLLDYNIILHDAHLHTECLKKEFQNACFSYEYAEIYCIFLFFAFTL